MKACGELIQTSLQLYDRGVIIIPILALKNWGLEMKYLLVESNAQIQHALNWSHHDHHKPHLLPQEMLPPTTSQLRQNMASSQLLTFPYTYISGFVNEILESLG